MSRYTLALSWVGPSLNSTRIPPGRMFVNSASLESVGSVQATVSLVRLAGVLFPVLYCLNYENNTCSL